MVRAAVSMSGLSGFLSGLEKAKQAPAKIMARKMMLACQFVHEGVTSRTPVHTGESLRNWVWSMNEPNSGTAMPALGEGDPGQTSKMRLGSEPRRPANQAPVDASLARLNFKDPFRQYWLSNNSKTIAGLEYGQLPNPQMSRSPNGMVRITVQELLLKLQTGAIR